MPDVDVTTNFFLVLTLVADAAVVAALLLRAGRGGVLVGARRGGRLGPGDRSAVGGVRVDRRHGRDLGQPLLLGARGVHPVRAVLVPADPHVPAGDRARGRNPAPRPRGVDHAFVFVGIGAPLSLYHWLVERVPAFEESSSCSPITSVQHAVVREARVRHVGLDGDERLPGDRSPHGVHVARCPRPGARPRRYGDPVSKKPSKAQRRARRSPTASASEAAARPAATAGSCGAAWRVVVPPRSSWPSSRAAETRPTPRPPSSRPRSVKVTGIPLPRYDSDPRPRPGHGRDHPDAAGHVGVRRQARHHRARRPTGSPRRSRSWRTGARTASPRCRSSSRSRSRACSTASRDRGRHRHRRGAPTTTRRRPG